MNDLADVESIFLAALEKDAPAVREAYLHNACGPDLGLRLNVDRLLKAHEQAGDFLRGPLTTSTAAVDEPCTWEAPGATIGPYKLIEQIGEGGMGVVYVAEQARPVRRRVALKVIRPGMDTKQVISRFEAERQALAMMDHPNIAKIFDAGATESGRPYFAMELVRGVAVTEHCNKEKLSIRERLELFVLVCRAVQHAHQKGVIHRDLKPSNIMVTINDGAPVPKVIDFGIAKATGPSLNENTACTAFAQLVGTPLYMSPEQIALSGLDVDTRSDLYSLGVLLYELLTGTTPFNPETLRLATFDEMRRIIREDEPETPSTRLSTLGASRTTTSAGGSFNARRLDRSVRGELDWIVMKALAKDRRRRYETAGAFAADVTRYLTNQPVEACPPSAGYRLAKFARRNRAGLITIGSIALSMILAIGVLLASNRRIQSEKTRADEQKARAEADFRRARDVVDRIFTRVAEDLKKTPGMEQIQRALLDDALEFYQGFLAEHGDDPEVRFEAARAAHRVGSIYFLIGDYEKVERPMKEAIELLDPLIAASPGETSYRVESAESHSDLGQLFNMTHRSADGIVERRKTLERYEKLVVDLPENATFRRRLASTRCNLGLCLSADGETQFEESERHLRASLAEWKQIQADLPGLPEDDLELSRMHHWLGNLLTRTNRIEEAEREIETALAILQKLFESDRKAAYIGARFAHSKSYLASLKSDQHNFEEAVRLRSEAIAILEPIAAAHPHVFYYRRRLDLGYYELAWTLWKMGRIPETEMMFLKGLKHTESLVVEHRGTDQHLGRLADKLYEYGMFLDERQRLQESADLFRRSIEIYEQLAVKPFSPNRFQNAVLWYCTLCPAPQFRDEARAVRLAKQLLRQNPTVAEYWSLLGMAQCRQGDWANASEALQKAVELDSTDPFAPLFLAILHWKQGDKEQARSEYDKAEKISAKCNSDDFHLRRCRSEARALLGLEPAPLRKTGKPDPDLVGPPRIGPG